MTRPALTLALLGPVVFLAPPSSAQLAGSLARFVPERVHVYSSWHVTPDQARLARPFLQALRRLADSGIGRDLFDLLTFELSSDEREQARTTAQRVIDLLRGVRWGDLVGREGAFAYQLAVTPELLVLFRVSPEEVPARMEELRELLAGVVEFWPEGLSLGDTTADGVRRLSLQSPLPMAVTVASKRDVIIFSVSATLLDDALRLLDSEDGAGSLASSERFQEAMGGLPEATDSQGFVDLGGYVGFVSGLFELAASQAAGNPDAEAGVAVVRKVFKELGQLKSVGVSGRVAENRVKSSVRVTFRTDREAGFIESLFRDQRPLEGPVRVVPREARAFCLSSGVDWERIYDGLVALAGEIPQARRLLDRWARIQERTGFDLKRDLLSWLDGGWGWVSLPGERGGSDWVCFLRVKDPERAQAIVRRGLEKLQRFLERRGQQLAFERIEDSPFREVHLGALPSWRPLIGLPPGVLVVASSAAAVRRVGDTYRGEAPSFGESPRFRLLDVPDAPLRSVGFQEAGGGMKVIADLAGVAGLVLSLFPEDRETRPALKLGAVLSKLARYVREVDLIEAEGSWERYDGESRALYVERTVVLRSPGAREEEF